jgi:hypothetical protein
MKSQEQTPKLLDQVRDLMRLHHYSIHTERSYTDWIKRYIHFTGTLWQWPADHGSGSVAGQRHGFPDEAGHRSVR